MKRFILLMLPAFLIFITSCNDKVKFEKEDAEFKFQKELTIQDENGNSADIIVYTNSEDDLTKYTKEAFFLNTTTRTFTKSNNQEASGQEIEDTNETADEEVFIMVTSYDLDPNITGFNVISKFDTFLSEEITTRAITSFTSYGSYGTNGAYAAYVEQTCNKEYLNVSLKKKNSSISVFWNTLASTSLYSEGDNWSWDSSTTYYKYKLKFVSKKSCGGTIGINYYWLT